MRQNLFLLLLFCLLCQNFMGQQVGINTNTPNPNAGLHVSERLDPSSTNFDKLNGVIIQRYTTAERNTLSLTAADNGLTIYNKDENCYNYWDGNTLKWKKLCGQMGAATLDLSVFDCTKDYEIKGKYITGTGLTSSEYISVSVKVDEAGTYDFKAYATPHNGYSFSAVGEFVTTGVQTVIMYGSGVPVNAQNDNFKLTLNGVEVCPNLVKVQVSKALKPLSNIRLGDIGNQPETLYAFATTWFKAFMNSWSNFGPIPASTVYTDGNPLAPESLTASLSDLATIMSYDILAVSYSNSISAAQAASLQTFAETPGKTLILHTEMNNANERTLLSNLIGDITIVSADYLSAANIGVTTANSAQWITSDPANAPFLNGIFGNVTGTYMPDHATSAPSLSKTKLDTSSNIQYIAYRGNSVSAFKIKNKNVFWIEDGAPFHGSFTTTTGPACFTPQAGSMGVKPVACSPTATNGNSSGGSIFAANMVYWALQQVQ